MGVRAVASRRERRHPRRPQPRACGGDGEWIFFLDDDASLLADAAVPRRRDRTVSRRPVDRATAAAGRRPEGKANRAGGCRACARATRRIPAACSRVGGRDAAAEGCLRRHWRLGRPVTSTPTRASNWHGGSGTQPGDRRRVAWYAGDLVANHPAIEPTRHADLLPAQRPQPGVAGQAQPPVGARAVLRRVSWTLVQLVRSARRPAGLRAWFGGWGEGWRGKPGDGGASGG